MSHLIYTTEGFVLKGVNFGEANKLFFILTKDFGLIKATAQGARLLKSKLRYNLDTLCFGNFSLVRGREVWRLTSVVADHRLTAKPSSDRTRFLLLSRISSLLLRLLHGEERNDFLFESVREGLNFLSGQNSALSEDELANFECILALRILSSLGYIGSFGDLDEFIASPYFNSDLLTKMSVLKNRAILEINRSLKETQL